MKLNKFPNLTGTSSLQYLYVLPNHPIQRSNALRMHEHDLRQNATYECHFKIKTVTENLSFCSRHMHTEFSTYYQLSKFISSEFGSTLDVFPPNSYKGRGNKNRKWRWIFAFDRCEVNPS